MPLLFTYGALQQEDVQMSTFGRLLKGQRDALPGFELALVRIEDPRIVAQSGRTHHFNVMVTDRADSQVGGTVFEVTDAELAAADRFEQVVGYGRVSVLLVSGRKAWVYVDSRTAPGRSGPTPAGDDPEAGS